MKNVLSVPTKLTKYIYLTKDKFIWESRQSQVKQKPIVILSTFAYEKYHCSMDYCQTIATNSL